MARASTRRENLLRTLMLSVWAVAFSGCNSPALNLLHGWVDGLETGDRVFLAVADPTGSFWVPVDSTTITEPGKFELKTALIDVNAVVTFLKPGQPFDPHHQSAPSVFLEGYADLRLTGTTGDWWYLRKTGGIYDHSDLQEAFRLLYQAQDMQRQGLDGLEKSRTSGDPELRKQAIALLNESNELIDRNYEVEADFFDKYPDAAYSAHVMRYRDDDLEAYRQMFDRLTPGYGKVRPDNRSNSTSRPYCEAR
ncbi:MAG: hypothetical protein LUD68_07605 [Rikenellaceae bacterium]|nr:hypothetical protein [Rikenellaceae bacterium]